MADFRNKQWFKALTDEEKASLCEKYGCTLQGLKKAGHVEDGRLKVDLLRLEMPMPEDWKKHLETVETKDFKDALSALSNTDDVEETLKILEAMYQCWFPGTKFLKPDVKKSIVALWINQCKLFVGKAIERLEATRKGEDSQEKTDIMIVEARKAFLQLNLLFNSELCNIKS